MKRIANKNVCKFVGDCLSFKANNIFGEIKRLGVYVVYSYGYHFPMYAKINGVWYGNKDKYSCTTSKHQGQARPDVDDKIIDYRTTSELIDLIEEASAK